MAWKPQSAEANTHSHLQVFVHAQQFMGCPQARIEVGDSHVFVPSALSLTLSHPAARRRGGLERYRRRVTGGEGRLIFACASLLKFMSKSYHAFSGLLLQYEYASAHLIQQESTESQEHLK